MKLVSVVAFASSLALSIVALARVAAIIPFFFGVAFGIYGIANSVRLHRKPLNDVPNALRVFLAAAGGLFVTLYHLYLFPAVGVLLLIAAVFLNDEYQRRAIRSLTTGRRGGSIALLGIDGSGKSSHSTATANWLAERGYRCTLMAFHRYLFVERLAAFSSAVGSGSRSSSSSSFGDPTQRRKNPIRPLASLIDNILLQISTSIGCRLEGRVVIYDRFIWSTYIKYKALGYPVRPLSSLYLMPRPLRAIVLDVPVEKSLRVIDERVAHIHYPRPVLASEREQYLSIARRNGYLVIDSTDRFDVVQEKIQRDLEPLFPPLGARVR